MQRGILIFTIAFTILATNVPMYQKHQATALAEELQKPLTQPDNFKLIVNNNAGDTLTAWTGQLFSIINAKTVGAISATRQQIHLQPGNYVLMLHFKEDIPELKGHRPFTFTITKDHKTTFTLTIGGSRPEAEKDIIRTIKGEDYINFPLPIADPALCKSKCEKDRNCGAYTYCYYSDIRVAKCYLIHGAGTPGAGQGCVSGIIQREDAPYQIRITTTKMTFQDEKQEVNTQQ